MKLHVSPMYGSMGVGKGGRASPWILHMILILHIIFNKHLLCKYISTLTNHLRWLALRAGVIKAKWRPGYTLHSFFARKWPRIF